MFCEMAFLSSFSVIRMKKLHINMLMKPQVHNNAGATRLPFLGSLRANLKMDTVPRVTGGLKLTCFFILVQYRQRK
jgi:hypothetical protein